MKFYAYEITLIFLTLIVFSMMISGYFTIMKDTDD
jgi:hypothetical protein